MTEEQIYKSFMNFVQFLRDNNADQRLIVEYSLTMAAGVGHAVGMDSGELVHMLHERLDHNAEVDDKGHIEED
jgi:hypothetical protein